MAARAGWFLPVIGMLFGSALAAAMSLLVTPQYTANSQLFVSTTDGSSTQAAYQGSQFSEGRIDSYVQLLTSEQLATRVISAMGLTMTAQELQQQIVATAVPDTVVLTVQVTNPSPQLARDLTATIDSQFTAIVTELETPSTTDTVTDPTTTTTQAAAVPVKVAVIDAPDAATSPSSPLVYVNIAVGALVGLVVGALGAYLRVRLDRTVRDPELASELTGAPVIGVITRDPVLERQHVLEQDSQLPTAEGYRQLRNNLQFLDVDEPPKVVLVASALAGEGKTTLAVNLAVTLAENGHLVTLVEADLRRPRVTKYLGLVGGAGLTNLLAGNADLEDMLQPYGNGNLSVIAAGPTPPNPGQLLASTQMASLIADLRSTSDFVIIDAPPLLPVSDASGVAVLVDGVVLSVLYGSTRRDQVEQAAATLERVGAKLLGVVLNMVPPKAAVSEAYGYGETYDFDGEAAPAEVGPTVAAIPAADVRRARRAPRRRGATAVTAETTAPPSEIGPDDEESLPSDDSATATADGDGDGPAVADGTVSSKAQKNVSSRAR